MIAQSQLEIKQVLLRTYFAFGAFYGDLLNGRIARAYRIVMDGLISRLDENTYLVAPQTNGRQPYRVTFNRVTSDNPGWQCDCPDCGPTGHAPTIEFGGGVQPTCKHIVAVLLMWTAQVHIPWTDAPPAPAPTNGNRTYNHRTTCKNCKCDWQECYCTIIEPLPEPARITTPENINTPLTVAEQKQAARNSLGIKQEAGRRTSASLAIRNW